jgi:DNA-binding MarR family transcriptional regulator
VTAQKCQETLTKLGLTKLQAEVYLVLTNIGNASAKTIANTTKIDRAHIYQVTAKLQEIGLVQKILAAPNLFRAISLQEGLQILLERRNREFAKMEAETIDEIKKIKETKPEDVLNEEDQFTLIPGKEMHFRVFTKIFGKTQTSYDGIFIRLEDFCRYLANTMEEAGITLMLLDRGVKFRLIVCNPENRDIQPKVSSIIRSLNKDGAFDIRYKTSTAAAMFGIIDKKELYMHVGSADDWREKPSLQSNNPCLVAMAQGYFDQMWETAIAPCHNRINHEGINCN